MKYIRTKDGIMKIDFEIETELPVMIGVQTKECEVGEYQGIEVIKQADTIEELCDEFVLNDDNTNSLIIHNMVELDKKLFNSVKTLKNIYKNIYGAIWTDKGLIYVAKMNDKGELELL